MPMTFFRSLQTLISRLLIGAFFAAQMALAAHACSVGLMAGGPGEAPQMLASASFATDAQADAADGDRADSTVPDLCFQHCSGHHASSDQARAPLTLTPLATLAPLYVAPKLMATSAAATIHPVVLADAGPDVRSRPHAVMHCVLRL